MHTSCFKYKELLDAQIRGITGRAWFIDDEMYISV